MQKITTIVTLTILLPTTVLAITCAPDDATCKTEQQQLEMMRKTGIQPLELIKPSSSPSLPEQKTNTEAEKAQPKPFVIPPAGISVSTTKAPKTQQNTTPTTPSFNFINATNQNNETQENASQTPTQESAPQPTGIIYR